MFTDYIDIPQMVLYAFWIFFAGLIWYLRQEDKREGYPLESERSKNITVQGLPWVPKPKTFILPHGGTVSTPRVEPAQPPIKAAPIGPWPGAPLVPTGDPLADGVGPGAWSQRADKPEVMVDGSLVIVPMRSDPQFRITPGRPDAVGMTVTGADDKVAGTVRDIWVDRADTLARYFEVTLTADGRNVLVPVPFGKVDVGARNIRVRSILASQFAGVPATRSPDVITLREEDQIAAYYSAGRLYATPERSEPLI
jgi:photosynthetic reaction center H subunit